MKLKPVDAKGLHQEGEAGTIASLAQALYLEYVLMGYSTTTEDISTAIMLDFAFYAGWATTTTQEQGLETEIDENHSISFTEWAILEPVIRAHCDFIQSQRVEGTGSLGGERFGLSVSEAKQAYADAKLEMKKEAFVEAPFTLDF